MINKQIKKSLINIAIGLIILTPNNAYSAEKITLFKGIFSRSISVKELEIFSQNGEAQGFLKKILKNQDKKSIINVLKKEYKAPIQLTSRLLYSQIGEVILKRLSKIIYPNRIPEENISVLALKAGTIKAIDKNNESISLIRFLKAYPSKVIAIDVTELLRVTDKVESMNELVKFFSNSPLEKLQKDSNQI